MCIYRILNLHTVYTYSYTKKVFFFISSIGYNLILTPIFHMYKRYANRIQFYLNSENSIYKRHAKSIHSLKKNPPLKKNFFFKKKLNKEKKIF